VAGAREGSPELRELTDGGQVHEVKADLSTATGPAELVAAAHEHGPLDVLVNNVGAVTPGLNDFLEVSDEQWLSSLDLTFMPAVRITRTALPDMLAASRGTIANTCSVNAFSRIRPSSTTAPRRPRWRTSRRPCRWRSDRAVPGSTPSAPARLDRPVAGGARRRGHRRPSPGGRGRGGRARSSHRNGDRSVQRIAGGRRPRPIARQRAGSERHQRRLGNRRRARQDPLTGEGPGHAQERRRSGHVEQARLAPKDPTR
jgi:short chain dehydrogenase